MKTEQIQKARIIKTLRNRCIENNLDKLQSRKEKFMDWLVTQNWNPNVEFLEMYKFGKEIFKSKKETQYPSKLVNTRTKILSETCAESDYLDYDKAMDLMIEIIQILMKRKIHFAVFYAEGQRSLHIRIYDFEELKELKPFQRFKAQEEFWKSIVPFNFHNLDSTMWIDGHYYQLEFSCHWKYNTPFNLIMEWIPMEEKCKN